MKRFMTMIFLVFVVSYAFTMYKYYFMPNTYSSSIGIEAMGQQEEPSLDIENNTEEKEEENVQISEEANPQEEEIAVVEKTYNLKTADGREEYIWDFLIKCRIFSSASCRNNR